MKFIGITGGVGAGKSAILDYLGNIPKTEVMLADEIAHKLMEPGTECYKCLEDVFSTEDIFSPEGGFDRNKLAAVIFSDADKRELLNSIVHPAVKSYVRQKLQEEEDKQALDLLVLEAALLIEEQYDEICDELWYIYTEEDIRRKRLKASRGYSDAKIDNIFNSQMKEDEYRKYCQKVIDNNGELKDTIASIEKALKDIN